MKTQNRQFDKNRGSALILVVVVTVLLAVVGVMFLMISRAGEAQSGAVVQSKDLSAAVDTVVNRINDVLVDDLFGQVDDPANPGRWQRDNVMINGGGASVNKSNIFSDEPWDAATQHKGYKDELKAGLGFDGVTGTWDDMIHPGINGAINRFEAVTSNDDIWLPGQQDDFWLASLEPVFNGKGPDGVFNTDDDEYFWPRITDLWGQLESRPDSLYYQRFSSNDHIYYSQNTRMRWIDPDRTDNATNAYYGWHTAGLWDKWQVSAHNVKTRIIKSKERMDIIAVNVNNSGSYPSKWEEADAANVNPFGARADADGDGVADSRWVQIPNLTASRGEPVFAAVRIIDNCAMLNLNGAFCFDGVPYTDDDKATPFAEKWEYWDESYALKPWHDNAGIGSGRYLSEINYLPFLRGRDKNGKFFEGGGGDYWYNLMTARRLIRQSGTNTCPALPGLAHYAFMDVEDISNGYSFFDVADELELRNRYMVTSLAEARFERSDVANFTLDSGSTDYAALQVPRDTAGNPISIWYERIDPANFDKWDLAGKLAVDTIPYKYDRRHICTFYSFDRTLRVGQSPLSYAEILNDTGWTPRWTPQQIAATKQGLFWYPLLYQELKDAGVKPSDIVAAQRLFWPVGPVTTDIASPDEMLKVLKGDPSDPGRPYNNPETRRRILHLLFAFREYFYEQGKPDEPDEDALKHKAALSAAQVVANLIDYADNSDRNTLPSHTVTDGPFYEEVYGSQGNVDCTFITSQIIDEMINEAYTSMGLAVVPMDFGLTNTDIVFGYERQPFISEVYVNKDASGVKKFAIELLNPYAEDLPLYRLDSAAGRTYWAMRIGNGSPFDIANASVNSVSKFNTTVTPTTPGRYVIATAGVTKATGSLVSPTFEISLPTLQATDHIQILRPAPKWVNDNMGIQYILVDEISADDLRDLLTDGDNATKRDDTNWRFVYPEYVMLRSADGNYDNTLGQPNTVTKTVTKEFQLAVADNDLSPARLHELEMLAVQGNGPDGHPNSAITCKMSEDNISVFDFVDDSALLNYVQPLNRPLLGSLPGRININTAPVHVIAAAIPPSLADPNVADPTKTVKVSALQLAQAIVDGRSSEPYTELSDILNRDGVGQLMQRYWKGGELTTINVGDQSIDNDNEERDWILSNLANKFTVRSDTFTAYILVRLGTNGPQRRMIAIFDRSQVWDKNDRPRLVALHPVPDPH